MISGEKTMSRSSLYRVLSLSSGRVSESRRSWPEDPGILWCAVSCCKECYWQGVLLTGSVACCSPLLVDATPCGCFVTGAHGWLLHLRLDKAKTFCHSWATGRFASCMATRSRPPQFGRYGGRSGVICIEIRTLAQPHLGRHSRSTRSPRRPQKRNRS